MPYDQSTAQQQASLGQLYPDRYWPTTTWQLSPPATQCTADVHVFPCPHCAKCKCGKATVDK